MSTAGVYALIAVVCLLIGGGYVGTMLGLIPLDYIKY